MRRLTGKVDFRRTFRGRVVLQVEEEVTRWSLRRPAPLRRRWRDATVIDLTKVEMRPLVDLRGRGQRTLHHLAPADPAPAAAPDAPPIAPPAAAPEELALPS